MKVKSLVYAHSNSDGDCGSALSLDSSFFELRRKVSTKQLSISELFLSQELAVLMKCCNCQYIEVIKLFLPTVFNDFPQLSLSRIYRFCFPSPSKTMH
jgi:hypothetical protein